jgi:flagellar biosynthetic protein FlhB
MAFRDDTGKTEKPTPSRLGEARERGQVPLSREVTMAGGLLVSVLLLEHTGGWLLDGFSAAMRDGLDVVPSRHEASPEPDALIRQITTCVSFVAAPFAVLVAIAFVATALSGYLQIGLRFATKALGFKPERMNPVANLGRLLGIASVVRMLASLAKLLVLAGVLWLVMHDRSERLALLHQYDDVPVALGIVTELALSIFFWIALVVLLISLVDLFWQRYQHTKSLMMSKQEVEDERKRNDGDPMIKSRQRAARLELMRQRMMDSVPKADVVITNPTHFAVALRYDRSRHSAPEVVAKGTDEIAATIRELAREHGVPLMEDPPLARALYRAVKVGQQIPERFYQAVATVLSHVLRLKGKVA